MIKEEIMDLTTVCRSFPLTTSPIIQRENILDTIDTIFEGETQLVIIEGNEGIGKTTLLTQFAKRYPDRVFSLFITPTSHWTYDPQYLLLDLCSQLNWTFNREELNNLSQINDTFLRYHLFRLQGLAKQKPYYFLLDGLENIPEDKQSTILEMLPFGLPGFRFLLSGNLNSPFSIASQQQISHKSFPLAAFTLDETITYLCDLTHDRDSMEEIYSTFRGIPDSLASIRRIIRAGTSLTQLLQDLPSKHPQLLEIEWKKTVRTQDNHQLLLLALLAHSLERHTINRLAQISKIPIEQVQPLLKDISFIIISDKEEISFVSEAFRKFVELRLATYREQINTLLIDDLLHQPNTNEAYYTRLPEYLVRAERHEDLLRYLSPNDFFSRIVEHTQSLAPAQFLADLGINSALLLRRDEDLMRFSIQRATIDDFARAQIWRSEVEARIAVQDYNAALALAQGTTIKEDRLHLLATIAKARRKQELPLEPELLAQLRNLYEQIDHTTMSVDRATDIASDLIYSLPDLAVEMIESAIHAQPGDSSARDWAFTKLTLAATQNDRDTLQMTDTLESIQSRIENPLARQLTHSASFLFRKSSAREIIAGIASYDAIERLNLLRLWASANRTRDDALEVVEVGLKLMIQTTYYTPNARVLWELARPLPHAQESTRVHQLVGTFDSQKVIIEPLGPTEDYVRLQLLLADTESHYNDDFQTVRNRLIEIFFYICEIDDMTTKTQCMAYLANLLAKIDPQKMLETLDKLHSGTLDDLQRYIKCLLESTSDHYASTRGIIRTLAKRYLEQAFELARALNTEPRRDMALFTMIKSAVQMPANKIQWNFIEQALQKICDQDLKDILSITIIDEFLDAENIDETTLRSLLPFLNRIEAIKDPEKRCRGCCQAYVLLKKYDTSNHYNTLTNHLLNITRKAWEAIDEQWGSINEGFRIAKTLSEISHELARQWITITETRKDELLLEVPTTAMTYLSCLRLAIRAYCGLLPKGLASEGESEHLATCINRVPSLGVRATIWAELAIRHHGYKRIDECKHIVAAHVKPLLEQIRDIDTNTYDTTLITVAPALYIAHAPTTQEVLSHIAPSYRDAAYQQICWFLLQKVPQSEPFSVPYNYDYQLSYEEIFDLCNILSLMEVDEFIYSVIESIADSISAKKHRFSRQQRQYIIERLQQLIADKFPSSRYISHTGYVIAAKAQVARIEPQKKEELWTQLLADARQIPNISDKVFVLSILAISMPREMNRYKEIFQEAGSIVETITVRSEKLKRYQTIASLAFDIDSHIAKKYIEKAMTISTQIREPSVQEAHRSLIDLAYRIDPDFAALMASQMDDDPAKIGVQEQMFALEAKKRLEGDQTKDTHKEKELSIENYAQGAWLALGSLNSNRVTTIHPELTREPIQLAAKYPLEQTYPIFAWAIENAIRRYAQTDRANTHLRSIYLATLMAVELAGKMATRASNQHQNTRDLVKGRDLASTIVHTGERETSIRQIRTWFEDEVKEYLIICDEFFGLEDLEILKVLKEVNPNCKVQILTSEKHQIQQGIRKPWDEAYRDYWRSKLSDQDAPETEVVIVGTQTKHDSPIHDRWWLTQGGGLRVGTSLNSLGRSKSSEISTLQPEAAANLEDEVNQYLQRPLKREHNGERLLYSSFNL